MLEIGTHGFQFFNLIITIHRIGFKDSMLALLQRFFISHLIECKIMITSNDYFMLVRQQT